MLEGSRRFKPNNLVEIYNSMVSFKKEIGLKKNFMWLFNRIFSYASFFLLFLVNTKKKDNQYPVSYNPVSLTFGKAIKIIFKFVFGRRSLKNFTNAQ